jgi:hypothetical protein
MTRDEHVQRVLDFLAGELGIDPGTGVSDTLFILIDQAIADGVRLALHEAATNTASRN